MKEIIESRRMLGATAGMSLQELQVLYKGLMKKHHPDRFQDELQRLEAEELSQRIISAYKFLESIHPETNVVRAEEFEATLASGITNWQYKAQVLEIHFGDGSKYAFYGVQPNLYKKFVNTDGTGRFVRRHLSGSFPQRRVNGPVAVAA
jgi:DnaJ-class molecular chaperone